ncbi:MAG: sigma 54-interacting transcriptional regulator [Spirochaetales bacterium]
MIKVILISHDEELKRFCANVHNNHCCMIYFSSLQDDFSDVRLFASLVLIDFNLIERGYFGIIDEVFPKFKHIPILFLVNEDSVVSALKFLKYGIEDIIVLPCCSEYLQECITTYAFSPTNIKNPVKIDATLSSFIGISSQVSNLKKKLYPVAQSDLSVFILGETGTGKSFVAGLLHQLSERKTKKFVEENIAAIQENLVEGELFGTKNGAYTGAITRKGLFEYADEGTLFLDEIGCISNGMQAKLLQVLETGEFRPVGAVSKCKVDVRLISATNTALNLLKKNESFRKDLYYRISGIQLCIPPLRNRKEDIAPLALHFLKKISEKKGQYKILSGDAMMKLEQHRWPGNLREMKTCLEQAYCMSSKSVITGTDINFVF